MTGADAVPGELARPPGWDPFRHRSVVIEADGGSRGNPGPSAYGAVLKDAETGEVIAEDGSTIGRATNNVAEYSGLIGGLLMAVELAPNAEIEVRMDSKLVVEQMSGRWKIKHPDMKPLAVEANRLAPFGTSYVWIPREQNAYADRLANEALDGTRSGVTVAGVEAPTESDAQTRTPGPSNAAKPSQAAASVGEPDAALRAEVGFRGWSPASDVATTLVLVRHGVTAHTVEKRFSGGLASANPGLSAEGRAQVRATGEWLLPLAQRVDRSGDRTDEVLVCSPVRRTRESAEILGELFSQPVLEEPGLAEMEFGEWDGRTFAEVARDHREDLDAWLGSMDVRAGGGESLREVEHRVLAGLRRLMTAHAGKTIVAVTHVTPIKTLVAHALQAPLAAVYRMELTPASVTVLTFYAGGPDDQEPMASLRLFNALPPGSLGPGPF